MAEKKRSRTVREDSELRGVISEGSPQRAYDGLMAMIEKVWAVKVDRGEELAVLFKLRCGFLPAWEARSQPVRVEASVVPDAVQARLLQHRQAG